MASRKSTAAPAPAKAVSKTPAKKPATKAVKPATKAPVAKTPAKATTTPAKASKATVKAVVAPKPAVVAKKPAKAKPVVVKDDLAGIFETLVGGRLTEAQKTKLKAEAKKRQVSMTALQAAIVAAFLAKLA